jgi:putative transposase
MALQLIYQMFSKLLGWMVLRDSSDMTKEIEILGLRRQPAVLRRGTPRSRMNGTDRDLIAALTRLRPMRRRLGPLITPATILRWDPRSTRHPSRPPRPCPPLGHREPYPGPPTHPRRARRPRLASTIWNILLRAVVVAVLRCAVLRTRTSARFSRADQPLTPAVSTAGPTLGSFLRAQARAILACDVFHLDTITRAGSTPSSPSSTPRAACTSSPSPPTPPEPGSPQLARNGSWWREP